MHRAERVVKIRLILPSGMRAGPEDMAEGVPDQRQGRPGYASCQRIIIIREKPKNRKMRPVMPYWMPMTLWSVEKMYFRQKPNS